MRFGFPSPVFQAPDSPATPAPSGGADTPSAPADGSSAASLNPPSPDAGGSPSEGAGPSSFEFMFGPEGGDPSDEGNDGLSPPAATPTPTPAQPAPAQPATPTTPTPEPTTPATTATPAPTEPTSQTVDPGSQPSLDPFDPGALAAHLRQNQEQVIQHVADNLFKLSDKDVEELESNTVGAIPRLLARSFVAAQENLLTQMARIVPMMVQRQGEVTKRHTEAETEFYSRWPDLKKDQHGQQVMQYAAVYRQMHPQATRKEMIEAVGPMVMMAAKVVPGATPVAQVPGQPNGQASPMTSAGRPPQPAPFVPAGPSAGGGIPSTAPQLTPVEALFVGAPDEA